MRTKTGFILFAFLAAIRLSASVNIEIENGIVAETTGGVAIQIDGSLTEAGTGYFMGTLASGERTGMTTFAGLTLGGGMNGSITRKTGSAYAKGYGEGNNFKRYYEIMNSGGALTADAGAAYSSSGACDERNGLTAPYFFYRYQAGWTKYGGGSSGSPVSASAVGIPAGASDWVLSNDSFLSGTVTFVFPGLGWYMVSLPVIPPDSAVITLFPTALGGTAFIWDPSGGFYQPVSKMEPKKGYWLPIPGATTAQVSGAALTGYAAHFAGQGWYMIGSVAGGADFASPNDNPDGSVLSPAFGWDPVSESYIPETTLAEKQGYWAAVFGACDLTVGGAGGGLGKALASAGYGEFTRTYGHEPPRPPKMDWKTGRLAEAPKSYRLFQNYPNPFNPSTTVAYQICETGRVRVRVINGRGEMVKMLVDGDREAGYYTVNWDGRRGDGLQAPSGVYFIRMQAGKYDEVQKVMLLK
jgi:hypothetical protein